MVKRDIIKNMMVTIIIVIISFFVWNNNHLQAGASIASSFNNRNINVTFEGFNQLSKINTDTYKSLDPSKLYLRNTTKEKRDYELYYTISKQSTVDFNTITIALDDELFDLKNTKYIEDDKYYYFLVKADSLDAYSDIDINVRIWTTATQGSLTSSFITR